MDTLVKTCALLEEQMDPRVKEFFLMDSPLHIIGIVAGYLIFSTWLGPALMQNRKPYNLDRLLQAYDLLQVLLCAIFVVSTSLLVINGNMTLVCSMLGSETDYWTLAVLKHHWYYFLFKFFDMFDTVFFVLRKKNNHISFLHMYHHAGMFVLSWAFMAFAPGAQTALTGLVNSFVHMWMYGYYFVASSGPKYSKYLKYKIHITQLQMIQFVIIFVQAVIPFTRDCNFSKPAALLIMTQALTFLYLFGKFYVRTYMTKGTLNRNKTT
ncbi:hypothetical protein AMK59_8252 [Oryctes borbonicus]|uniref:Elongation of very long chain fatty acids protein n=1 Tax=Oryctes borbonicus TaxID=1629725 RepID=A0A0T6AXN0_9SCAR|nr:hypothetical protein AMK59_8252 [Oryctes borbonicus]